MTQPATVRFYFDFISPYAFAGWHQLRALQEKSDLDIDVDLAPCLFAGLLNHHGQLGPAEIPAKRVYVFKDAYRRAATLGRELIPPPSHPFRPLTALRAVIAAPEEHKSALVSGLFDVAWGGVRHDEGGLEQAAVVARVADQVGLDGPALLEKTQDPEVKGQLKGNTEAAIADGVFGVPSFLIEGELFWGSDSFAFLEARLRGDDPVEKAQREGKLSAWANLPASAQRPR